MKRKNKKVGPGEAEMPVSNKHKEGFLMLEQLGKGLQKAGLGL